MRPGTELGALGVRRQEDDDEGALAVGAVPRLACQPQRCLDARAAAGAAATQRSHRFSSADCGTGAGGHSALLTPWTSRSNENGLRM